MDEMKLNLQTKFMNDMVSKILNNIIRKKLGYDVNIQLDGLNVEFIDGETSVTASASARLSSDDFKEIMKKIM